MIKPYLDREVYNLIIKNFSFNDITEIRMRINNPLIIVVKNKKFLLKDSSNNSVIVTRIMIDSFIQRITENSLYAVNDCIINGFITLPKGVRVGLAGYVVSENGKIVTIKNFQAINIRIPHFIRNCCLPIFDLLYDGTIKNTLIISPPGAGKTTFLRDFVFQLSQRNISQNLLIADERNEICSVCEGNPILDLGGFCDIYTNCSKKFAFTNGVRSMRPDAIITDEIDLENDVYSISEALNCGVNVVATIHARNINQLKNKPLFDSIIDKKMFSRYVVLSSDEGPGTITTVYDENLHLIYCRCV